MHSKCERTTIEVTLRQTANPLRHVRTIRVHRLLIRGVQCTDRLIELDEVRQFLVDQRRYGLRLTAEFFSGQFIDIYDSSMAGLKSHGVIR